MDRRRAEQWIEKQELNWWDGRLGPDAGAGNRTQVQQWREKCSWTPFKFTVVPKVYDVLSFWPVNCVSNLTGYCALGLDINDLLH